ncbi:hypothetical protein SAMN05421788_1095 [Filimonas lacunae]|uniref:Uncharacterized protein n=1 Tax=Filimonas lacunae TaxID=477680 RepID=A0A173MJ52_9BACT|nr:hypothetical protein [Filimonas lacunae]BAV07644.1 hypothetical protein FLA_3670 [Filimonas lacunae]SIT29711.1 hypothetical protein SAMN05421788_1095 [Filimonas lacunae]
MHDLQFLENQGWEQMQELLHLHMPQQKTVAKPVRFLTLLLAAACLLVLFCIPALLSDTSYNYHRTITYNADGERTTSSLPQPSAVLHDNDISSHNVAIKPTSTAPTKPLASLQSALTGNASPLPYSQQADSQLLAWTITAPDLTSKQAKNVERVPIRLPLIFFPANNNTRQLQLQLPLTTATTQPDKQTLLRMTNQQVRISVKGVMLSDYQLYSLPSYPSVGTSVQIGKNLRFSSGMSSLVPGNFGQPLVSNYNNVVANNTVAAALPPNANATPDLSVTAMAAAKTSFIPGVQSYMKPDNENTTSQAQANTRGDARQITSVVPNWNSVFANRTLTRPAITEFINPSLVHAATVATTNKPESATTTAPDANTNQLYNIRNSERRFLFHVQYQFNKYTLGLQYSRAFTPSGNIIGQPQYRNQSVNLSLGIRLFR